MGSHYETLGVSSTASTAEIRKAYLRRARALHPDRNQGKGESETQRAELAMQQVNIAWSVLSDPVKKSEYDGRFSAQATASGPVARQSSAAAHRSATSRPPSSTSQGRATPPPSDTRASSASTRTASEKQGSAGLWASIPVLVIVGLAVGIFIVTAFAGDSGSSPRPLVPTRIAPLAVDDCFFFATVDIPAITSCELGRAEGQVVQAVPRPDNCPAGSLSMNDPSSDLFLCWIRMQPGSTNAG